MPDIECPYDPETREAAAYWAGREAQIPPPQIVMEESLSEAWDRGMDDRQRLRDAEMERQTREFDAEIDAVLNEPERVAAREKRQAARRARHQDG